MSVLSNPSPGELEKTAPGKTRDDLLALSESAGRRGAEKVDELFNRAIAAKLKDEARP